MYRCYFTRDGRIVMGASLELETLSEAIAEGHEMLTKQPRDKNLSGIEIWQGTSFLYTA